MSCSWDSVPSGPTHEASRRVLGRRRAVATGAADRHVRRKRARLRHRGDGREWADGARPSEGDRWTLMAVRHPDFCGRALPGRSADDGATDDPDSRRPHLRARSTPTGRSGPFLRAPLAGTPTRAHQRLPGLPGAPRRSVRNPTEAAYARSDLFERRRRLMDDWASAIETI